jgi:hypothetical protein
MSLPPVATRSFVCPQILEASTESAAKAAQDALLKELEVCVCVCVCVCMGEV